MKLFIKYIFTAVILLFFIKTLNGKNLMTMTWEIITDEVMGGQSEGGFKLLKDNNEEFVRLEGIVSTKNNGGFIQIRSKVNLENDYSSINFLARGNHDDYFIHIRTPLTFLPWQFYSIKFNVTDEWKSYTLELRNFKKSHVFQPSNFSADSIKTIAFVAYGKNYSAKLDIKNINFITYEK